MGVSLQARRAPECKRERERMKERKRERKGRVSKRKKEQGRRAERLKRRAKVEGGGGEAGCFSAAWNPPSPLLVAPLQQRTGAAAWGSRRRGEHAVKDLKSGMINEGGAAARAEEADGAMINLNELLSPPSPVLTASAERGSGRLPGRR